METNKNNTFENYITNKTNGFAAGACRRFAENAGDKIGSLFIHGDTGVGKTHLIQAAVNLMADAHPNLPVKYVTAKEFTTEIIDAFRRSKTRFDLGYKSLDVLIIDDIEYVEGKKFVEGELYHIIAEILDLGKYVITTSNRKPVTLFSDFSDFRTRLESFCSIGIDQPDEELVSMFVERFVTESGLILDENVRKYIISYSSNSIVRTKSALQSVKLFAEMQGHTPNLEDKQIFIPEV